MLIPEIFMGSRKEPLREKRPSYKMQRLGSATIWQGLTLERSYTYSSTSMMAFRNWTTRSRNAARSPAFIRGSNSDLWGLEDNQVREGRTGDL